MQSGIDTFKTFTFINNETVDIYVEFKYDTDFSEESIQKIEIEIKDSEDMDMTYFIEKYFLLQFQSIEDEAMEAAIQYHKEARDEHFYDQYDERAV